MREWNNVVKFLITSKDEVIVMNQKGVFGRDGLLYNGKPIDIFSFEKWIIVKEKNKVVFINLQTKKQVVRDFIDIIGTYSLGLVCKNISNDHFYIKDELIQLLNIDIFPHE